TSKESKIDCGSREKEQIMTNPLTGLLSGLMIYTLRCSGLRVLAAVISAVNDYLPCIEARTSGFKGLAMVRN
ncbi:MAG: hypothetical protein VB857_17760, partial [Pirellulaceae bacterium]